MAPDHAPSNASIQLGGLTPVPDFVSGRRKHRRYPISAESQYVSEGNQGRAISVDISSGGVFLKAETALPVGKAIEVWIDWPVLLDQRCPLRLVIGGRVLRSDARGTAVGITRYEFRLRPRSAAPFAA